MSSRVAMIADRDAASRKALAEHLAQDRLHAYHVIEAAGGEQAWIELQRLVPDVLLLGQLQGGPSAVQLLSRLRTSGYSWLPVLFLSGVEGDEQPPVNALALGADDHLSKEEMSAAHTRRSVSNAVTRARLRYAFESSQRALQAALVEAKHRVERETRVTDVVSHDLRTPLAAVTVGVELLRKEQHLSARGIEVLRRVERSVIHMRGLVMRLFDSAARESGQLTIVLERASLAEVLGERVTEISSVYPSREIRLLCDDECLVECDPTAIGQVIGNLVQNAITHGASESPITVSTFSTERSVGFTVENHGTPIPSASMASVFEPYSKPTEHGAHDEGLGLGLFIAEEIVRAHGGDIAVTSNASRTRFEVALPRNRS